VDWGGSGSDIVGWHLGAVFSLVPTRLECSTKKRERAKKPRSFFRLGVSFQKAIAHRTEITYVYSVCLVSTLVSRK
jgi:hypothetical protein